MQLTRQNYFDLSNSRITNSKINDFLKSKEYYFRKWVKGEIPNKQTDPMKVGSIVDAILSGEEIPYSIKCLKSENATLFERQKTMSEDRLVTKTLADKACALASEIMRHPFYEDYAAHKAQFQRIVTGNIDGIEICGMIDILTLKDGIWFIDDVKTTTERTAATPKNWWWHCQELGYFRQFGGYRHMLSMELGIPESSIVCRHVVASKVDDEVTRVRLYRIPDGLITQGWNDFEKFAKEIAVEKLFKDKEMFWDDSLTIPLSPGVEELKEEEEISVE